MLKMERLTLYNVWWWWLLVRQYILLWLFRWVVDNHYYIDIAPCIVKAVLLQTNRLGLGLIFTDKGGNWNGMCPWKKGVKDLRVILTWEMLSNTVLLILLLLYQIHFCSFLRNEPCILIVIGSGVTLPYLLDIISSSQTGRTQLSDCHRTELFTQVSIVIDLLY